MHAERAGVSIKSFTSWNKTKILNSADPHKCMASGKAEQINFNALLHFNATLWRIKRGQGCVFQYIRSSSNNYMRAVVSTKSNTIKENARCWQPLQKYHTMQHVAILSCFQLERTLLCKHGPFEEYKRRQRTVFLIHVTRSQWKEQGSTSKFKIATVADVLRPPKEHICSQCRCTFTQKRSLLGHIRTQHRNIWKCSKCARQRTKEKTISSTMKETAIFELQGRDVIQIRLEVLYRNDRGEMF